MDKETQKSTQKTSQQTEHEQTSWFRRTLLPILLLLLLGGAAYYIWQQRKSVETNKELATKYKEELVSEQEAKAELGEEYKVLEEENIQLQDSIVVLKNRITELSRLLKDKVGIISRNKGEITRMQNEMNRLVGEMSQLKSEKGANQVRLKQLENERFALDQRIGDLYMQNDTLENENNVLLYEIVTTEKERDNLEEKLDVKEKELAGATGDGVYQVEGEKGIQVNINAIEAEFKTVQARTQRNKRARSAKKWKKTAIEFDVIYPALDDLLNQNFSIQLMNEDTDEVISPREANPGAYDAKGLEFAFTGNPVKVDFVNWQQKKDAGTNYTIRLFFVDGAGKEVSLASAVAPVTFKR